MTLSGKGTGTWKWPENRPKALKSRAEAENGSQEGIISRNKRLYNDLREILSGLEETFDIRFSDDELAYMIAMVKKL